MPKMSFNEDVKEVIDSMLLENIEVEPGKAFGLPAYYINGKMFAGVYEDGATIKVATDTAAELLEREGIQEFRPMEKHVMKNWVLIRREDPNDYLKDRKLFDEALEYVRSLTKDKRQ